MLTTYNEDVGLGGADAAVPLLPALPPLVPQRKRTNDAAHLLSDAGGPGLRGLVLHSHLSAHIRLP